MAATTQVPAQVSEDEYLHTAYEVDCDYVDGVIEERAVGEYDHATWQTMIASFFTARQREWGVKARTELRVRIGPRRYRVPDVCLLSRETPLERIVITPPLAIFEILSPEDRMKRVLGRLADFERMGVGAIWVIDPHPLAFYRFGMGQLTPASLFVLPGTRFEVEMAEIAAMID